MGTCKNRKKSGSEKSTNKLNRLKRSCQRYLFCPARYARRFSDTPLVRESGSLEPAREVVFCFWTGDNDLTPNRLEAIETMRRNIGVEVKLITPANLGEWIVEGAPLHPGYEFLSLNHRSDYLRNYFMHHHGGGYADIKRYDKSWKGAFDRLNGSDKWGLGYYEVGRRGVVRLEGKKGKVLKRNWRLLIGNGAFIFRPHTPVTKEWYDEVQRRMYGYLDELKRHPGDMWGKNEGYPIPWAGMQGNIMHPLSLKYNRRLMQDNSIIPSFENYR